MRESPENLGERKRKCRRGQKRWEAFGDGRSDQEPGMAEETVPTFKAGYRRPSTRELVWHRRALGNAMSSGQRAEAGDKKGTQCPIPPAMRKSPPGLLILLVVLGWGPNPQDTTWIRLPDGFTIGT